MQIRPKTKMLTECAVMIALSAVLSLICVYQAPYGGKVTLGSMVPIVFVCVNIKDFRFGLLACFTYSLVQMLLGFAAPPTATLGYFIAVVFLDYILAFTLIFVVNPISRLFRNSIVGVGIGTFVAMLCRFLCHFITGILIWGVYAPEGQPVWLYSLIYNGGYMIPEAVITILMSTAIFAILKKQRNIS